MAMLCLVAAAVASAKPPATRNGFAIEPSSIPAEEILAGGPPRDGIPALDRPRAVTASESDWTDDERVIGIEWKGEARAYPLSILVWHEIVNDELAGRPILVSFCPLCGTGIVFDRTVAGKAQSFGVSGLLYRSDLLMFDRGSESLWSQVSAEAVTGPLLGQRLTLVRSRMDLWGEWRKRHPGTTVLSRETGHSRPYYRSPYGDYERSEELRFPVPFDRRYHPKMPTLGLRVADGPARAYPAEEVHRAGGAVTESFAGRTVRVAYDLGTGVFEVQAPEPIEVVEAFWFAWSAFHPETTVFVSGE